MHHVIESFIQQFVRLTDVRTGTEDQIRQFWTSLDVHVDWIDLFVTMDPHWDGRVLTLHRGVEMMEDSHGDIHGFILYALH